MNNGTYCDFRIGDCHSVWDRLGADELRRTHDRSIHLGFYLYCGIAAARIRYGEDAEMNNDLISRSALQRCLQAELEAAKEAPEKDYAKAILDVLIDVKLAPTVDAEPVRHDGCALCNIKETGHGVIAFYGIGWQVCINKRGKNYYLVMGHEGSQTEMLIGYCPACGAKMDGDKDATD